MRDGEAGISTAVALDLRPDLTPWSIGACISYPASGGERREPLPLVHPANPHYHAPDAYAFSTVTAKNAWQNSVGCSTSQKKVWSGSAQTVGGPGGSSVHGVTMLTNPKWDGSFTTAFDQAEGIQADDMSPFEKALQCELIV